MSMSRKLIVELFRGIGICRCAASAKEKFSVPPFSKGGRVTGGARACGAARSANRSKSAGKVLGKPSPGVFLSAKHTAYSEIC